MVYVVPLAWQARSVVLGRGSPAPSEAAIGADASNGARGVDSIAAAGSLALGLLQALRPALRGASEASSLVRRTAFPAPSGVLWAFVIGPSSELETALLYIFVFVVLSAIFVAVGLLYSTHTFLVLTGQVSARLLLALIQSAWFDSVRSPCFVFSFGQTTIEYQQRSYKRAVMQNRGQVYRNPFDHGYRKNWIEIFGPGPTILAMLPSLRPPPLPVELQGDDCGSESESAEAKSSTNGSGFLHSSNLSRAAHLIHRDVSLVV
jgi:hypothetical protein